MAVKDAILVICAIGALAVQFWAIRKPVETKIAILFGLAEFTSSSALVVAVVFLITTDKITWPSACAFYNFLVQVALFIISPRPAARRNILSIVFAAVIFATVPMYAATNALLKMQSDMVYIDSKIISVLDKLTNVPSPSPSQTP